MIIVASVSCIYGLGSPEAYYGDGAAAGARGSGSTATQILRKLVDIQYERNDIEFGARHVPRARRRRRGLSRRIEEQALRIEFFGDEIDARRPSIR